MDWTRGRFLVTTSPEAMDMVFVTESLQALWRRVASRESIEKALKNSLCFALFDSGKQVGFVRAVSDHTFVSWVCDLFVDPTYQNKGLGRWLMECLSEHPDLSGTRLVFSATSAACAFYEHLGYLPMQRGYSNT